MTSTTAPASVSAPPPATPHASFHHRNAFMRMPLRSRVALGAIALFVGVAFAAPLLPLSSPYAGDLSARLLGFGEQGHLLGTDGLGRDVLSRLVYATRTSLIVSIVPIVLATIIGLLIGMVAGLTNSRALNAILMRGVDILFAFPGVVLALLLSIAFGAGVWSLIIAVTAVWISPVARIAETEVMRVRELDFVMTARSSGSTAAGVFARQILPVTVPAVSAYSTSLVGASIAITGGLGFIGLGVPAPQPELGSMLGELQAVIYTNPMQSLLPVFVILALSTLFPIVGDGIRDAINGREADA